MAKADIQRQSVTGSSNVAEAGFDAARSFLDIQFKDGSTYRYLNVSAKVWEDFQAAASKGRFVHAVLKKYEFEKLDGVAQDEQGETEEASDDPGDPENPQEIDETE